MEAALILYGSLGVIAIAYLIFILTPGGRRWMKSLDD